MKSVLFGVISGFINSIFGAGGGVLTVPYLKSKGLSQKEAQASSLAVLLPLTLINTLIYYYRGYFSIYDGIAFIPFGFFGAMAGVYLIRKIPDRILNVLFSLFMLYSGIRLVFMR